MKNYLVGFVILLVSLLSIGDFQISKKAYCGDVTQIVFSCTSTVTSGLTRPNLRIKTADNLRAGGNTQTIQALPLQSNTVYNYYMTKSITFLVTDKMVMIEIQSDMDTTYKINSESNGMVIQAGVPIIRAIRK